MEALPKSRHSQPPSVAAEHLDEWRTGSSSVTSDPAWRFSPERVLVCVGATPFADQLIRTGRKVASTLDAELVVIHVEATDVNGPSSIERQRLTDAFELARQLGARVEVVTGRSIANEILRYARQHSVVKIVVGRPSQPWLLRVLRGSV